MPDIKATITRPVGPLPAYAWVLVIVGGYFGYKFLSGRSGSSPTAAVVGGPVGVNAATDTYATDRLTNQLTDLQTQVTDLKDTLQTNLNNGQMLSGQQQMGSYQTPTSDAPPFQTPLALIQGAVNYGSNTAKTAVASTPISGNVGSYSAPIVQAISQPTIPTISTEDMSAAWTKSLQDAAAAASAATFAANKADAAKAAVAQATAQAANEATAARQSAEAAQWLRNRDAANAAAAATAQAAANAAAVKAAAEAAAAKNGPKGTIAKQLIAKAKVTPNYTVASQARDAAARR